MATPDAILQHESGLDATLAANAQVGQLADATPDTMSLHTKDAYRIFTGRGADAASKLPPIPGGRRFAAVLKSIWHLSANDNPYADWILIRMYEGLLAIRAHLSRVITAREEAIEILKRKGLSLADRCQMDLRTAAKRRPPGIGGNLPAPSAPRPVKIR